MRRRGLLLFLAVAAVGSLGTNIYLRRRPTPPPKTELETPLLGRGTQLQEITGRNERADVVTLRLNGTDRPTMLYFVTPTCVWCTRNRDNFAEIVRQRSGEYRIVLVSLSEAGFSNYIQKQRPRWADGSVSTLTGLPAQTTTDVLLGATPQTMIVGRDGRVTHNWVGAYVRTTLIAVENLFLVQMPGLVGDRPQR